MKKDDVAVLGETSRTPRGFGIVEFRDTYDVACSLQISSRAVCENEEGGVDDPLGWVWLGPSDARPQIMKSTAVKMGLPVPPGEVSGWMPYPIPDDVLVTTRMHLDEKQVRGLIARLQTWLATGGFEQGGSE